MFRCMLSFWDADLQEGREFGLLDGLVFCSAAMTWPDLAFIVARLLAICLLLILTNQKVQGKETGLYVRLITLCVTSSFTHGKVPKCEMGLYAEAKGFNFCHIAFFELN